MNSHWKEAATIILTAAKRTPNSIDWNYSLLTLKRSIKASFMPNGIVFPGGNTHSSDSSKKWLSFFPKCTLKHYEPLTLNEIPPILNYNELGCAPKLLSLKITAIRETFEETGILLCCKKNESNTSQYWACHITFPEIDEWRQVVQKDASKFLNMCEHYDCYPDVQSISLWSNWLTPTSMGSKRFDTVFFITSLREVPDSTADCFEIENLDWNAPDELMNSYKNANLWLPPPQFYELSRISQFKNEVELVKFARMRNKEGCQRWMPQQIKTEDGLVSLLPGDDAYNTTDFCSLTAIDKISLTTGEFRSKSNVLHRMEFMNSSAGKIIIKNYKPVSGHILPMSDSSTE